MNNIENLLERLIREIRETFSDRRMFIVMAAAGIGFVICMYTAVTVPAGRTMYFYDDNNGPVIYVSDSIAVYEELAQTPGQYVTVNINTASVYDLAGVLPGIGQKKAEAIVEYRELNGGFKSLDELLEVRGISESLYYKIRPYCRLSGENISYVSKTDESQ